MKRSGPLKRRTRLKSNAAAQLEWERRTMMRRREDPEHRDVINRRLSTIARKESAWQEARTAVQVRSGGRCEANWDGVCPPGPHRGEHVHHRRLRAQGGSDELDNLMHVCRVVHQHAHDVDRAEAERRGIIIRGWVDPSH